MRTAFIDVPPDSCLVARYNSHARHHAQSPEDSRTMAEAPFRNAPLLTEAELRLRIGEFYRAVEEFNDGYYFESHETLEDLWMVTPLPARTFFQGVIQLAAAFVHFYRREYPGIVKLLDAAIDKLSGFTPEQFGVDVSAIVAAASRVRDEIAALGEDRLEEWDAAGIPRIGFERIA
jgi:predicted metal-dependent hydrolase